MEREMKSIELQTQPNLTARSDEKAHGREERWRNSTWKIVNGKSTIEWEGSCLRACLSDWVRSPVRSPEAAVPLLLGAGEYRTRERERELSIQVPLKHAET